MCRQKSTNGTDFRTEKRNRLVEVRAQIYALQSSLELLKEEREELEEIVDNFFYPISSIPDDILSSIFFHCLPDNDRGRPSRREAPLNLAGVSRHWRTVALSTSELWCSVDLSFVSLTETSETSVLLERWLSRAKSRPLSITMRCGDTRVAWPPSVIAVIRQFCVQWEHLEIELPSHDLPSFQNIRGPFPVLTSCSIHFHKVFGVPYQLTALREAPNLRELRLYRGVSFENIPVELCYLTSLEIHDLLLHLPDCAQLFRSFPRLVHFSASVDRRRGSEEPLHAPPSLQSLRLDYDRGFLAGVTLPGLRRLEYRMYESDDSATMPSFLSFINRSSCSLQDLILCVTCPHTYRIDLSESSLIQCLRAVPSLTTLRFTAAVTAHQFYKDLGEGTLLPNLRELYMCETAQEHYDYAPMTTMLAAIRRRGTAPQLCVFELDLGRQPPKSERDRKRWDKTFNVMVCVRPVDKYPVFRRQLRALVREGLHLRIKYPDGTVWPLTNDPMADAASQGN
ncbi:hypothetical protein B0H11DRAFT_440597 [Mycena galericulata]|nr:hypothetical protein B0H11DRAFT_440597 [Mycena galericulata]